MSEQLYNIVRFGQNGNRTTIERYVTLEEAREICNDPDTSSHTARKPQGCDGDEAMIERWNEKEKHWFYGFEKA